VKVRVDPARCSGYTLCNQVAPSVFKLDEWGFAFAERAEVIPGSEDKVREAAAACPEDAILIDEE
jgi:ferredoxin